MVGEIKTKGIAEGFKDVDVVKGIVTGYFAHFGSKDSDGDIIDKGAFAKAILAMGPESKQPRIKHLLDHNKQNAVAKILVLKEDDYGLYYESKAGRHTAGQDFLKMVEDGIITEHSHGYIPEEESTKSDGNHIEVSYLMEGSSLQFWGANANTPVTGVKSFESMLKSYENLNKALRNGTYTDETFIKLYEKHNEMTEYLNSIKSNYIKEVSTPYINAVNKYLK